MFVSPMPDSEKHRPPRAKSDTATAGFLTGYRATFNWGKANHVSGS
jgi:hypothetical protein